MDELKKLTSNEYAAESGVIYTMLRRLERRGLVASRWKKQASRVDRRVYTITEKGKMFLMESLKMVKSRKILMDSLIQFHSETFEDGTPRKRRRLQVDERNRG